MALVVVGASLAGVRAVEGARRAGYEGDVVLVGAEEHLPYDRPPLTKAYLLDEEPPDTGYHDEDGLRALGVTLRLGAPATGLDLAGRRVLQGDDAVPFDALVVATGATPRRLDVPGADLPGVHVMRTLDDARAVRAALRDGARTVVVGGGFVGAEVASAARARGLDVTVVEAAAQPLVRALGAQVAGLVAGLHGRHGTDLRCGAGVSAFEGDGRVQGVRLSDGSLLPADLVVVGAGAVPATGWLEGSGLGLDDGVLCDAALQAAPGVWAAGDVARFALAGGGTARLEHWTAAAEQGSLAGANAVSDDPQPYVPVPYAWTEWYGVKLQTVGACRSDDVTVVGDVEADRWVALYRDGDRLAGAVTVGLPGRTMKLRRVLVAGAPFDDALALVGG